MWRAMRPRSMRERDAVQPRRGRSRRKPSVLDRRIERDRAGLGRLRYVGPDRRERAVVLDERVEHALDRGLDLVGAAIAHFGVLESGLHDLDTRFLADRLVRYHAGIGLELRILGAERENLELAVGDEGHAQVVQ